MQQPSELGPGSADSERQSQTLPNNPKSCDASLVNGFGGNSRPNTPVFRLPCAILKAGFAQNPECGIWAESRKKQQLSSLFSENSCAILPKFPRGKSGKRGRNRDGLNCVVFLRVQRQTAH